MVENNYIIGVNWEQNSTVSIMCDGSILESVSEERFSRIKNDERYPKLAMDYLKKKYGLSKNNIFAVCMISKYWSPVYSLIRHYTNFSIDDYIKEQNEIWYKRIYENKKISFLKVFKNKIDINQYPGKFFWKKIIKKIKNDSSILKKERILKFGQNIRKDVISKHLGVEKDIIHFIDHSFGHAAYAYCSGNQNGKNSTVLTIDAFGDFINYSCYKFSKKKGQILFKKIISGNDSIIARLYRYTTLILGLKPNEHEYKLMGMAPYSKEIYYYEIFEKFKKIQNINKLRFKYLRRPKDMFFSIKKIFDGKRFDNICGGLQKYTEYLIIKWVINCVKFTKYKNICLAGGVAMNVKANFELSKMKEIKNVFIPPSPDDSSQAMGACYAFALKNKKINYSIKKIDNAYLGYDISFSDNNFLLRNIKKNSKYIIIRKNINFISAKLLKKNLILCRAVGKAEFGARSLGNRSILANPNENELKKEINEKVKGRDFWMPFAASVINTHSKEYFKFYSNVNDYQYMTNCLETNKIGKKKFKAAIHPYDETCRPQIVYKDINKDYYNLINCFGKMTGTYGLLNTSFNIHGKPIVNSAKDAFEVFKKTNLDGLILPNCLILKKENSKYL